MSNVKIIKGDLFAAPKNSIICHACNCYGVWGAGIALKFAAEFPTAKFVYSEHCKNYGNELAGTTLLIPENKNTVGCLFTSEGVGATKSSKLNILRNTWLSINDLIKQNVDNKPIHMCKINSGLFGVEWEKTQKVLETFENQEFTVYEY